MNPTITRCQNYATGWGFGGLIMTNPLAYRATSPRAGQPKHPLYLRRDLQPIPYELGKSVVG